MPTGRSRSYFASTPLVLYRYGELSFYVEVKGVSFSIVQTTRLLVPVPFNGASFLGSETSARGIENRQQQILPTEQQVNNGDKLIGDFEIPLLND